MSLSDPPMNMHEWTAQAPERLDIFLVNNHESLTRSQAQKHIRAGAVRVNGKMMRKPGHLLQSNDHISLADVLTSHNSKLIAAHDLALEVLYEDSACLVINKPSGIAVHPGNGMTRETITILHGLASLFHKHHLPFSAASSLVHRLDKDTTGCLLIAKSPAAQSFLQEQFEGRSVHKSYIALVAGVPSPPAAIIDAPIGRSSTDPTKMSLFKTGKSREAQTTYRTLALSRSKAIALLLCQPRTGRTHQLRVHLSSIGHPILGDEIYNSSLSRALSTQHGICSICLHAWKLSFFPPEKKKRQEVIAPPPSSFLSTCKSFAMSVPSL